MGDWVAHPSNTVARKILVTHPLLTAVSGEGSQNLLALGRTSQREACCSFFVTLGLRFAFPFSSRRRDFFKGYVSPSLYLSLVFTCKHKEDAGIWSISRHEEQAEGEQH
jgi:hypothetical protein